MIKSKSPRCKYGVNKRTKKCLKSPRRKCKYGRSKRKSKSGYRRCRKSKRRSRSPKRRSNKRLSVKTNPTQIIAQHYGGIKAGEKLPYKSIPKNTPKVLKKDPLLQHRILLDRQAAIERQEAELARQARREEENITSGSIQLSLPEKDKIHPRIKARLQTGKHLEKVMHGLEKIPIEQILIEEPPIRQPKLMTMNKKERSQYACRQQAGYAYNSCLSLGRNENKCINTFNKRYKTCMKEQGYSQDPWWVRI